MSSVSLSPSLLGNFGVTCWQAKPAFQQAGFVSHLEQSSPDLLSESDTMTPLLSTTLSTKWVLFGEGLNGIWQAQGNQAWLLWQAIMAFHLNSPEQMLFFDTHSLQDEERQFEVLDQVIETGVEQVFTMDADHPINDMLIEGTQLVVLPHFEQLLEQPSLKREVYLALLAAGLGKKTANISG